MRLFEKRELSVYFILVIICSHTQGNFLHRPQASLLVWEWSILVEQIHLLEQQTWFVTSQHQLTWPQIVIHKIATVKLYNELVYYFHFTSTPTLKYCIPTYSFKKWNKTLDQFKVRSLYFQLFNIILHRHTIKDMHLINIKIRSL